MTITAHPAEAGPYLGDGVQDSFPIPFVLPDPGDLVVILRDDAGGESAIDPADITVTGDGWAKAASVTLSVPPASGSSVTLLRRLAHDQPADFQRHGLFQADRVEAQLDRQAMQAQQLADGLARAPLLPVTGGVRNIRLAAPVAGTVLRWSDDGTSLEPWAATADVTAVAALAPDIAAVLAQAAAIETVADRAAAIDTVAGLGPDLSALAPRADDLSSLAPIVAEIATVAGGIAAVTAVAAGLADVDSFANRYLPAGALPPATRPDGGALAPGDLYFDTGLVTMMVFDGTVWTDMAPPQTPMLPLSGGTLSGPLLIDAGSAGAPGLGIAGAADTGLTAATGGGLAMIVDGAAAAIVGGDGIVLPGAVGGRLGPGTLNAAGLSVNGTAVLTDGGGLPDRVASLERNLALLALRQEAVAAAGPSGLIGGLVDGFVDGSGLANPIVTAVGPTGMTGASQGTVAVSASSLGMAPDPAFEPWTAFDGITDPGYNGWAATNGFPQWLQVDYGVNPAVVNRYEIDGNTTLSANARDWIVQGSQDGLAWTTLDTRTGVSDWGTTLNQTFDFANQTAYRFYRWTITADNGFGAAYIIEMRLSHRSVGTENAGQDPVTDTVIAIDAAQPWQAVAAPRTAAVSPDRATALLDVALGGAALNAAVTVAVSRDGGTSWSDGSLTNRLDLGGGRTLCIAEEIDLSAQPAGTSLTLKAAIAGGHAVALHGWALTWR